MYTYTFLFCYTLLSPKIARLVSGVFLSSGRQIIERNLCSTGYCTGNSFVVSPTSPMWGRPSSVSGRALRLRLRLSDGSGVIGWEVMECSFILWSCFSGLLISVLLSASRQGWSVKDYARFEKFTPVRRAE